MAQEMISEIKMRTEKFTHTTSGDGRVYCKLASLLPVDYFSVVAVENTVGDHEDKQLPGDILPIDLNYYDRFPVVKNPGKDEKLSTRELVGAIKSFDSDVNPTSFKNKLKISSTSRTRKIRAIPYKLRGRNTQINNKLESNLNRTSDIELSKEFKLDILTDVMQYIQNLQSILDRDGDEPKTVRDRDVTNLSQKAIPANSQPQSALSKTVESSQSITKFNPASSEAERSSTSSTISIRNGRASSSQVDVCTAASRREDASAGLELLELKTGAITLTA